MSVEAIVTETLPGLDLSDEALRSAVEEELASRAGGWVSVSYTHLDVYKRQEYSQRVDSLCGNMRNISDALTALNTEVGNSATVLVSDLRKVKMCIRDRAYSVR